jgi:hypothetical protein
MDVLEFNAQELEESKKMVLDLDFCASPVQFLS